MKNLITENYGCYSIYDDEPQWMKDERYDYCEEFFGNNERKGFGKLAQIIISALHSLI